MSGAPSFDYAVFGLRVRSEVPLPELFPANIQGESDVTIRLGTIDSRQHEPGLHELGDGLLFVATDAGRYKIAGGRQITIDPNPGAPDINVRLFLLGSAFGALLHQRGLLPLHANAVEIEGKAVAFMGESGAGKSTLAAWFHDRGFKVVADDVCAVIFNQDAQPYVAPGLPRLRLWSQALEFTGRDSTNLDRSYVGAAGAMDKFDVPLATGSTSRSALELAGLYRLERGDEFNVEPLYGVEAAEAIFDNTYRGGFIELAGSAQAHWQSAVRLVRSCPVFAVKRKWELAALDEQAERLLREACRVARG